jgi:hypothetical protein
MAQTRERPASQGRSGGTKSSKRSSAGSRSRAQGKPRASKATSSRSKANASRNGASAQRRSGTANGVLGVAKGAAVPVATAVAGAAAGVVVGRRNRKPRKVLGIPIPGTRNGLGGLAKEVRKAGKQFGHLASEVQTTRKKAEDVGKAIS